MASRKATGSRARRVGSRASGGAAGLSHLDASGRAKMVDVGDKTPSDRVAIAEARVTVSPALARAIRSNTLKKGNLLEVARLAGIGAAKRTSELIPLCHALPLDHVDVAAKLVGGEVRISATARTFSKTGVEMEALTAAAVAALTVIDMGKAIDKGMTIYGLQLLEKRGGRSGVWRRAGTGAGKKQKAESRKQK